MIDDRLTSALPAGSTHFGRPDLPDVLIFRIRVKPSCEKYFAFSEAQIRCMAE